MSAFRHLLLTRFNVRGFVAPPADPDAWLAHRADLFERVCLPSVRAQTHRFDRWLVLFDEATPAAFRERIASWAAWEVLLPCFLPTLAGLDAVELVRTRGGLDRPFVLTTRLDNDDGLARDFAARVQDLFAEQSCLFVNFDHGAALADGRAYAVTHRSNPFATLIERSGEARTVWCAEHNRLGEHGPVEHLGGPPMWLQTLHSHNVSNRPSAGRRLAARRVRERFEIDPALVDAAADGRLGRALDDAGFLLRSARSRLRAWTAAAAPAAERSNAVAAEAAALPPVVAGPRISVVVPTCDRPPLLARALDSLAAQTWRDFEVIVVDDAGAKATAAEASAELVARFAAGGRLPALRVLRQPRRRGASAARNRGVRAARHPWVLFLDDDDELLPDALERLAACLAEAPPDLAFTWGGIERIDDRGRAAGRLEWPAAGAPPLAHLAAGTGYALTVRRAALTAIGGFDESLAAGVDFDLLLRLGRRFRGRPMPGVFARIHLHAAARLTDATARKAEAFERIADKHRAFLTRHPEAGLPFLLKAARQSYGAGRRRPGRRLLARALRLAPRRPRTLKSWLLLELFGHEPAIRRRRAGRLPSEPPPARWLAGMPEDAGGPFFSVVVPTHDRADLLGRALASVGGQDEADFELLVVDDGSTDATAAVLAAAGDPRLRVVRRAVAGGAAAARNAGAAIARGRWLLFLDDDDALAPGALTALRQALEVAPAEVGFAWCARRRVASDGMEAPRTLSAGIWRPVFRDRAAAYRGFLRSRRVGASGLAVRRGCFLAAGGFDEALRCAEDTDLLIRLARDHDFRAVPEAWIDVHLHPGRRLTTYGRAMAEAYARILAKHREVLEREPAIAAEVEYKTAWLYYHGRDRASGRHHLWRALCARPTAPRPWLALALFELAGPYAPAIHRRLAGRGARRPEGIEADGG